jgi:hypothetical protein
MEIVLKGGETGRSKRKGKNRLSVATKGVLTDNKIAAWTVLKIAKNNAKNTELIGHMYGVAIFIILIDMICRVGGVELGVMQGIMASWLGGG